MNENTMEGNMDYNNYENGQNNYSAPETDTGYSYGNGAYGNNAYYNGNAGYGAPWGGVPTDETGRPLKNRHGLKVVFSILEILSCCLLNVITLIIGIIALVFTCKANSSYKRGDVADFKSNAKASSILLWVGFGIDVVVIALWIAFAAWIGPYYSTAFQLSVIMLESGMSETETSERLQEILMDMMENGESDADIDELIEKYLPELSDSGDDYDWDDYDWDDYDWDDYYDDLAYADADKLGTYWSFQLDGVSYTLPIAMSDFMEGGYALDADAGDDVIEAYSYVIEYFYSPDGTVYLGAVEVYNPGSTEITVSEGTIILIELCNDLAYDGDYEQELLLSGGITFESTREEVLAAYGESTFSEADETNPVYDYDEWICSEEDYDNENFVYIYYEDGVISEVGIGYMGE